MSRRTLSAILRRAISLLRLCFAILRRAAVSLLRLAILGRAAVLRL